MHHFYDAVILTSFSFVHKQDKLRLAIKTLSSIKLPCLDKKYSCREIFSRLQNANIVKAEWEEHSQGGREGEKHML